MRGLVSCPAIISLRIGCLLRQNSGPAPINAHSSHRMPNGPPPPPRRQLLVCGQFFVPYPITFWEVSDGEEARSEDSDDSSSPEQYNNRRLSPSNRLPSLHSPPTIDWLARDLQRDLARGGPYFTRGEVHLPSPLPLFVHLSTFTTLVRTCAIREWPYHAFRL